MHVDYASLAGAVPGCPGLPFRACAHVSCRNVTGPLRAVGEDLRLRGLHERALLQQGLRQKCACAAQGALQEVEGCVGDWIMHGRW